MMSPSFFRNGFDDFMDWPTVSTDTTMMKSDVRETADRYELLMDLPGFRKEDVKLQLKNGVLHIEATTTKNNDQKDDNGKYLRRERFQGTCSRSFYVGKDLKETDITAKFENGVLTVTIPKQVKKPEVEEKHYIPIEG